jgi:hypothetical protein
MHAVRASLEQDVGGLDVAVDETRRVHGVQSGADLGDDPGGTLWSQLSSLRVKWMLCPTRLAPRDGRGEI